MTKKSKQMTPEELEAVRKLRVAIINEINYQLPGLTLTELKELKKELAEKYEWK